MPIFGKKRRTEPGPWVWRSGRPRVLIENHDPASGRAVQQILLDEGYEVAFCPGAEERTGACPLVTDQACSRAAEADAVLYSLRLADDDDREVLAGLREHFPDTPVIVELPAPKIALYEKELVGCETISQPVSRESLVVTLRRVFGESED